jgi:nitrilase
VDLILKSTYISNTLKVDSLSMKKIQDCAAKHKIIIVLGYSENRNNSLYISQSIINKDRKLLTTRSKIKATHMERTLFGDTSAECLNSVADTSIGRVGALSCWEHIQPLLKYHT